MKQKEIIVFLGRLGLGEKEIAVYLKGFQYGPMHATALAKACVLTRPNVYDVLKRLGEKGLCHQLGALYGRKFKMAAPGEVQVKINRERKLLEQLESDLVLLTPALDALRGQEYVEYPKVEYFEGQEGLRALFDATLRGEGRMVSATASISDVIDLLGDDYAKLYVERRMEKSIRTRTLRFQAGEVADPFYYKHRKDLEVRYAPAGLVIRAVVLLWDDKVAIIPSRTEKLGIIIHSEGFAETMQSWFDFFWKIAKPSRAMARKKIS
jgi:sugar-specific transcriptional regulator TrmB